jgi:hypothetical protein
VGTTNEPLALRAPVWVRTAGVAFPVLWVYPFATQLRDGFLVPGVAVAALLVALVVRTVLCSVVGTADGRLTARNRWSTRTFLRADIRAVGIERPDGRGWAVLLLLEDGSRHPLDVTETPFLGPSLGRLERQVAEVRSWLEGRPRSFA